MSQERHQWERGIEGQGPICTLILSRDTNLKSVSWYFSLCLVLVFLLVLQALVHLDLILHFHYEVANLLLGFNLVDLLLV